MMIPHPFIESCEHCNPLAEIPFDWILDRITGSDPTVTDYLLEQPAKCPNCRHAILEKTLIEPEWSRCVGFAQAVRRSALNSHGSTSLWTRTSAVAATCGVVKKRIIL